MSDEFDPKPLEDDIDPEDLLASGADDGIALPLDPEDDHESLDALAEEEEEEDEEDDFGSGDDE